MNFWLRSLNEWAATALAVLLLSVVAGFGFSLGQHLFDLMLYPDLHTSD